MRPSLPPTKPKPTPPAKQAAAAPTRPQIITAHVPPAPVKQVIPPHAAAPAPAPCAGKGEVCLDLTVEGSGRLDQSAKWKEAEYYGKLAQALGADLAYLGTRFTATAESRAPAAYKDLLVSQRSVDLMYTPKIAGVAVVIELAFLKGRIDGNLSIVNKRLTGRKFLISERPTIALAIDQIFSLAVWIRPGCTEFTRMP